MKIAHRQAFDNRLCIRNGSAVYGSTPPDRYGTTSIHGYDATSACDYYGTSPAYTPAMSERNTPVCDYKTNLDPQHGGTFESHISASAPAPDMNERNPPAYAPGMNQPNPVSGSNFVPIPFAHSGGIQPQLSTVPNQAYPSAYLAVMQSQLNTVLNQEDPSRISAVSVPGSCCSYFFIPIKVLITFIHVVLMVPIGIVLVCPLATFAALGYCFSKDSNKSFSVGGVDVITATKNLAKWFVFFVLLSPVYYPLMFFSWCSGINLDPFYKPIIDKVDSFCSR